MLPAPHRLRAAADFTAATRSGARVRSGAVVVYRRDTDDVGPARFGLIVGKTVGNSVFRHRVSRRLRAQLADRVAQVADGSVVVVRALPDSATASSADFGRALDRAFERLRRADRVRASSGSHDRTAIQ